MPNLGGGGERGDATQTSVWYLKERGKNRAHERKKSNGIVLRVINRGIRLLFHLMQNKMSYSFNCVFGELSRTRGVDVLSWDTLLDPPWTSFCSFFLEVEYLPPKSLPDEFASLLHRHGPQSPDGWSSLNAEEPKF